MFSTFYLAMVLVLVALIVRGLSFEFRGKIADPRWRAVWQWSLTIGSALVPLLLGTGWVIYCTVFRSTRTATTQARSVSCWSRSALYTGITLTILCLFLGATYLGLKTTADLRERTTRLSYRLGWLATAAVIGWVLWSHLGLHEGFLPQPIDVVAMLAVLAGTWFAESRSEGPAFAAGAVAIGGVVGSIFFDLCPRVMVSSTNPQYTLTVVGLGQSLLHPHRDDHRVGGLRAGGSGLPGVEPVDLPQTPGRPAATAARGRHGPTPYPSVSE